MLALHLHMHCIQVETAACGRTLTVDLQHQLLTLSISGN